MNFHQRNPSEPVSIGKLAGLAIADSGDGAEEGLLIGSLLNKPIERTTGGAPHVFVAPEGERSSLLGRHSVSVFRNRSWSGVVFSEVEKAVSIFTLR